MTEHKSSNEVQRFDIVIHNAHIHYGDCSPPSRGMVGIRADKIAAVGDCVSYESDITIDAQGLVLSPGFIDIHGHSDFSLLLHPHAESKIFQGVTTEVTGNCGLSATPLLGQAYERWKQRYAYKKLDIDWHEPDAYFERLRNVGTAINIVPLLGHTNLRTVLKGYTGDVLSSDDKKSLGILLDKYLATGFWGVSFGLAYPPGIFADQDEIELVMHHAREHAVYTSVHIRDEGAYVEESLDEVLNAVLKTKCSLQISHLKSYGSANWHKVGNCISKIENANVSGASVHFDRYPYCAFNTDLDAIIPQKLFDGGWNQAEKRLRNSNIARDTASFLSGFFSVDDADNIVISDICDEKRGLIGKRLSDIIDRTSPEFWLDFIKFLVEIRFQAEATFFLMNPDEMKTILSHPLCIVGSDSGVRSFDDESHPHPRVYGTFLQFIDTVIRENLMPLQEAVYKMTGLPASKVGLHHRGIIKEGYFADLVLWNLKDIQGLPTYDNPIRKNTAVKMVWVNGKQVLPAVENELFPGRVLLRT